MNDLKGMRTVVVVTGRGGESCFAVGTVVILLRVVLSMLFMAQCNVLNVVVTFVVAAIITRVGLVCLLVCGYGVELFDVEALNTLFVILYFFITLGRCSVTFMVHLYLCLLSMLLSLGVLGIGVGPLLFFYGG